jgi:hypothetical protein
LRWRRRWRGVGSRWSGVHGLDDPPAPQALEPVVDPAPRKVLPRREGDVEGERVRLLLLLVATVFRLRGCAWNAYPVSSSAE